MLGTGFEFEFGLNFLNDLWGVEVVEMVLLLR